MEDAAKELIGIEPIFDTPDVVGFGHCKYQQPLSMKTCREALVNFIQKGGLNPHPMVVKQNNSTRTNGRVGPGTEKSPRSISPSIVQRTDALLRGLVLILEHHDAKDKIISDLREQCHKYLDDSPSESVWLKRCKYLLCYPLARHLKNKLPPPPDRVFKPTGSLRGWMKARLNAFNPKNVHLWYSWFQAKRSTLPLSDAIVRETYEKHFETLTREDPGLDEFNSETIDEIFEDPIFKTVLDKLRMKVWKHFFYSRDYLDEFPKTSACFERPRSSGGQVSELRDLAGLWTDEVRICTPEFTKMSYSPCVHSRDGLKKDFVQSQYSVPGHEEWSALQVQVEKIRTDIPLDCTIQAVLEPNKIRVISKGNALPYYSCKGLQKVLHSTLKKMPCFKLIGRPFFPSDIINLTNKAGKDWEWLSIDYSAATDGLSYKYSSRIFENIICNLEEDQKALARSVLGPHNLYYPKSKGKGVELRGIQKNGQLMGSILSFPILCLANLGVYLWSTSHFRKDWTYDETLNHVLINGDDMVYAAPKATEHLKRHQEGYVKYDTFANNVLCGRAVGLEMSVGKAYRHREYLNINSQSVLCPLNRDVNLRTISAVNFLNTGLFYGLHKVQGKHETMELAQAHGSTNGEVLPGIVPNLNCLLEGSLPGKEADLLKKSLTVNGETIKEECRSKTYRNSHHQRNLFIPQVLGGMGINPPPGWKFKVTKNDIYVAHGFISKNPTLGLSSQFPSRGYLPERLESLIEVPWGNRDTGATNDIARVPLKRISYKSLRYFCRSPMFHFYVENRNHSLVDSLERCCYKGEPFSEKVPGFEELNEMLNTSLGEVDS